MIAKRHLLFVVIAFAGALANSTLHAQSTGESSTTRIQRTTTVYIGAIAGTLAYFSNDIASGKKEGFGPHCAERLGQKYGAQIEDIETTCGSAVVDAGSSHDRFAVRMVPKAGPPRVVIDDAQNRSTRVLLGRVNTRA